MEADEVEGLAQGQLPAVGLQAGGEEVAEEARAPGPEQALQGLGVVLVPGHHGGPAGQVRKRPVQLGQDLLPPPGVRQVLEEARPLLREDEGLPEGRFVAQDGRLAGTAVPRGAQMRSWGSMGTGA